MVLDRATFSLSDADLEFMVLGKAELPPQFQGHQVVREGVLDNALMAENGFPNSSAAKYSQAGRITGFMREFGPTSAMANTSGFDFLAATVAHLFDNPASVSLWMHEIFLKDFEGNIGESVGGGHQLISAERLQPQSFFDEAVALKVLQGGPTGIISSNNTGTN